MPSWTVWTLAIALLAAVFAIAFRIEDPLERWFLRRGRNQPWPTARLVILVHVAWFAVWFVVGAVGSAIRDATGEAAWAGLVVVPMILVHGPFVVCFLPLQYSGFSLPRRDFRRRGATDAVSRAMFWTGAPFAIVGMMTCFVAFAVCFAG